MDFFGELIEQVERIGFAPLSPSEKSKSTYTLHNLIRDQIGMSERKDVQIKISGIKVSEVHITSDMADVAFWDYKTLRTFLNLVHNILNDEVSKVVGKPTNAIAWSHDSSRTQKDIVQLLQNSRISNPHLEVPLPASKRAMAKSMVQKHRVEAAIANTVAVLVGNGAAYGDILESCSEQSLSNEGLLDFLDNQIISSKSNVNTIDSESLVPRQLVVSYFNYKAVSSSEDLATPTMAQYLRSIKNLNNLAGNSESTLLARLAQKIENSEILNEH